MRPRNGSWLLIGLGLIVGVLFVLDVVMGRNYFYALPRLTVVLVVLFFLCDWLWQRLG